jgi:hypothetical protein
MSILYSFRRSLIDTYLQFDDADGHTSHSGVGGVMSHDEEDERRQAKAREEEEERAREEERVQEKALEKERERKRKEEEERKALRLQAQQAEEERQRRQKEAERKRQEKEERDKDKEKERTRAKEREKAKPSQTPDARSESNFFLPLILSKLSQAKEGTADSRPSEYLFTRQKSVEMLMACYRAVPSSYSNLARSDRAVQSGGRVPWRIEWQDPAAQAEWHNHRSARREDVARGCLSYSNGYWRAAHPYS